MVFNFKPFPQISLVEIGITTSISSDGGEFLASILKQENHYWCFILEFPEEIDLCPPI